ncbi:Crp/Fnr family transcriptional regulator [Sphingomonas sp. GlSt437]|uniref:Crp/Fnr family transcriptional regulator n=1 Tax=Sphingomonas sp. GlSt437 TaxID=3389970 RepID=UPI003A89A622
MFSTPMIIAQLGYALLLAIAVGPGVGRRARLALAVATGLLAVHAATEPGELVSLAWLMTIGVGALLATLAVALRDGRATFNTEEDALRRSIFGALPPRAARHLIDQGWWLSGDAGDELAQEGKPVETLTYLHNGSARVVVMGRDIGGCGAGDLIGEATALSGEPATATVVLASPARFWCVNAAALRSYVAANPELRGPIEQSFRQALRAKLATTNAAMAAALGRGSAAIA